jgi:hypothetical protein
MTRAPCAGRHLARSYVHSTVESNEDVREWFVPVSWLATRTSDKSFRKTSLFANQNSACKLRAQFTIDEVSAEFELED